MFFFFSIVYNFLNVGILYKVKNNVQRKHSIYSVLKQNPNAFKITF